MPLNAAIAKALFQCFEKYCSLNPQARADGKRFLHTLFIQALAAMGLTVTGISGDV